MMTSFKEVFGDNADEDNEIPQEILDELNKELPKNLIYLKDEKGRYVIVPRLDRKIESMRMTTKFDFDPETDALLIEKLKSVPQEKWGEYLFRTQKSFQRLLLWYLRVKKVIRFISIFSSKPMIA